ncbi:sodium:proton exchanger [Nocardioidaceae bacterium]|nr:sodium:proton exchanger [Nocardioidaceae bacterium]
MTSVAPTAEPRTRFPLQLPVAALVALPGSYLGLAAYLGLPAPDLPAPMLAVVYGVAIVGAAFLLSWAAEAIQVDINAGLALALLALLAVLPEYAVDFVFTVKCGGTVGDGGGGGSGVPNVCGLALANMTGANRVLVGVGWPLVVLVAAIAVARARRGGADASHSQSASTRSGEVRLPRTMSAEVAFLGLATVYSLTLPLKESVTLLDFCVFVGIFVAYAWRLTRIPAEEPDLMGTSLYLGSQQRRRRRLTVAGMFAFAALVILCSAEHFAESLVETGTDLGINQFVLVQWVAPLASESPELIVACLYAARLKASNSLGALLSSKVNQWTLLVGGLPLVFALSAGTFDGLPLDTEQRFELLITASQSLFAVSLLIERRLGWRGAGVLLALFLTQFTVSIALPDWNRTVIIALSVVYLAMAIGRMVWRRGDTWRVVRDGFTGDMTVLAEDDDHEAAESGFAR